MTGEQAQASVGPRHGQAPADLSADEGDLIATARGAQLETPRELLDYLVPLRLWKWLILGFALAGFVGGWLFGSRQPLTYTSTASVRVGPGITNPLAPTPPTQGIDLLLEQERATSTRVAGVVRELLETEETVEELLEQVVVTFEPQSTVLDISYSDEDARGARDHVRAFAQAYLRVREDQLSTGLLAREAELIKEAAGLEVRVRGARRELAQLPVGSRQAAVQLSELQQLAGEAIAVRQELRQIEGVVFDPGTVISPPVVPDEPASSPQDARVLFGLAGLGLGLFLGSAAAYVREALSGRIRGRRDVEERLRAPLLGMIPPRRPGGERGLVVLGRPDAPEADDFWALAASVRHAAATASVKSLLVTNTADEEGKSAVTLNLAAALARWNHRVVLLTTDPARRFLDGHAATGPGLAELLSGSVELDAASRRIHAVPALRFIAAGELDSSRLLLGSPAMASLIARLETEADFVVVEGPSILAAETLPLASMVGGVLYVADARHAKRREIANVATQLEGVGAVVLGCVLNRFRLRKARAHAISSRRVLPR